MNLLSDIQAARTREVERRRRATSILLQNYRIYFADEVAWKQSYLQGQFYAKTKTGQQLLLCYVDDTLNGALFAKQLDDLDKLNSNYTLYRDESGSILAKNADNSIKEIADKLKETYGITLNYERINGRWCYSETLELPKTEQKME